MRSFLLPSFVFCVLLATASFASTISAQMVSFNLFYYNKNNTADYIFGSNSSLNDNASLRIGANFTFTGLAIFNSNTTFTNESFHDKIIASLPDEYKPMADSFRKKLIILEYCSWLFTTTDFKPCGALGTDAWNRFVLTILANPACMNRDLTNGFQIVPYNPTVYSTLVRFTFDGANAEEYFSNIFAYSAAHGNKLNLCKLADSANYASGIKEANVYLDTSVSPQSRPLPSNIAALVNTVKNYAKTNPGDTGAVVAIVIILVLSIIICCGMLFKRICCGGKNKNNKGKSDQGTAEQQRQQQAEFQRRMEARNGAEFTDINNNARNNINNANEASNTNNNNNARSNVYSQQPQQQPQQRNNTNKSNNHDDDEQDDMMKEIAAARTRMQLQRQQQQQPNNNNFGDDVEMQKAVIDHSGNDANNNNNDDLSKHHTETSGKMGLGSELFGLPRDGDQPAILSAPAVHEGHDTSAVGGAY